MSAQKKRGRLWVAAAAACAVVVAALLLLLLPRRGAPQWSEAFRKVAVEAVSFQESVEISGNVEPREARDLAFPVPGRVVEVAVREGQRVESGALLARLEDRGARYELAAVEASLEQKRLAGAEREIRLLELERDIKAQAVRDRELRAPLTGRVSALEVRQGDYTAAGRRVVRVVDVSSLIARIQVDELDAPTVTVGLPVRFFFDALPDLQVSGRVSALALEGRITSEGLTVVDGEVVIDRPPPQLLVGYSFTGEILVGEEERVLVIPESALVRQSGEIYVYLAPEGEGGPRAQPVTAEVLDSERVQVLSGLSEGQEVLVPLAAGAGRGGAKITTRGLLESLQNRARIPFLGGSSQNGSTAPKAAP